MASRFQQNKNVIREEAIPVRYGGESDSAAAALEEPQSFQAAMQPQPTYKRGNKGAQVSSDDEAFLKSLEKEQGYNRDAMVQEVVGEGQEERLRRTEEEVAQWIKDNGIRQGEPPAPVGGDAGKGLGETFSKMAGKSPIAQAASGAILGIGKMFENVANAGADVVNAVREQLNYDAGGDLPNMELFKEAVKQQPVVGQVSGKVAEYATPTVAALAAGAPLGLSVVGSSAIQFFAGDPDDARLADMAKGTNLEKVAAVNAVIDALAHEPDDSKLMSRWKMAVENAGVGSILAVATGVARATRIGGQRLYNSMKGVPNAVDDVAFKAATEVTPPAAVAEEVVPEQLNFEEYIKAQQARAAEINAQQATIAGIPEEEVAQLHTKFDDVYTEVLPHANNAEYMDAVNRIARTVEALPQTRGSMKLSQLSELGESMKNDLAFVQKTLGRQAGEIMNAEAGMATRKILQIAVDDLVTQAQAIDAGANTADATAKFLESFSNFERFHSIYAGNAEEGGRLLGTHTALAQAYAAGDDQIKPMMDSVLKANIIMKTMRQNGGKERAKEVASLVNEVLQVNKKVASGEAKVVGADAVLKGPFERLTDNLANYLLSNTLNTFTTPKNQILGSVLMNGKNLTDMLNTAIVSKFIPGADAFTIGRTFQTGVGMWQARWEGLRAGADSLKKGIPTGVANVVNADVKEFGVRALPEIQESNYAAVVWNKMGTVLGTGKRVSMALDSANGVLNYRGYVYGAGWQQASAAGLKGDAATAFVESFVENPPPNIQLEALQFAKEANLTAPVTSNVARGLAAPMSEQFPNITKILFPYARTRANVIERTLESNPLTGFFMPRVKAEMAAGGDARAQAIGRMMTHAEVMGGIVAAMSLGLLSWDDGRDYKTRKLLSSEKGQQPGGSFVVGDTRYKTPNEGMLNNIMSTAHLLHLAAKSYMSPEEYGQMLDLSAGVMAQYLLPEDSVRTVGLLGDAMDIVRSGGSDNKAMNQIAANFVIRGIPFTGYVKGVAQGAGPGEQKDFGSYEGFLGYLNARVRANLPVLADGVPGAVNLFGEPIKLQTGFGTDGIFLGSTDAKGEEVFNKLRVLTNYYDMRLLGKDSLRVSINEPSRTVPFIDINGNVLNDVQIPLTPAEYRDMCTLAGQMPGADGKTLKEELATMLTNFDESIVLRTAQDVQTDEEEQYKDLAYTTLTGQINQAILWRRRMAQEAFMQKPEVRERAGKIVEARRKSAETGLRKLLGGN